MNTAATVPIAAISLTGCTALRNGLLFERKIRPEEWHLVGRQLSELAGAAMWWLGDWLAYGQENYTETAGGKRVFDGVYSTLSDATGIPVGTLANAKSVCARVPIALRHQKLNFSHAVEIAGGAAADKQGYWIGKVVSEGLSVKALRVQLRQAGADYKPETNDKGDSSFLETTRQYVRDFQAASGKFTPAYRKELVKILQPVLGDLS